MQIFAKRMGLSGLMLAGVLVSGVAAADDHQPQGGAQPGTPDQTGEHARDGRVELDGGQAAQPGADPHQRSIGNDRMQHKSEKDDQGARGKDGRGTLPPVGAKAGDESSYTVRSGDTLGSISKRFLGNGGRWKEIAKANQIEDPNQLRVGTRLKIPQRADADRPSVPTARPSGDPDPQRGDTDRQRGSGDDRPGEDSMRNDEGPPDRGDPTTERPGAGT